MTSPSLKSSGNGATVEGHGEVERLLNNLSGVPNYASIDNLSVF